MHKFTDYLLAKYLELKAADGQGVIEYTLVAGVISLALFTAFLTTDIEGGIGRAVDAVVAEFPAA